MDSGPGADAPSRNDDPLDVSGFVESIVSDRSHRAGLAPTRRLIRAMGRCFAADAPPAAAREPDLVAGAGLGA
jgi:hypothetical protein